jgi:hypothetical protein
MARLKAERRRFEYREKTLLGFVTNAVALLRPGMQRTGKGLLPMLFNLLVSGRARREIMTARQALATRSLSNQQFGKRQARADRIKTLRDAQMQALSHAFDIQKAALDMKHEHDIAQQKQGWRDLAAERKKLWDEWREEFGQRPVQRQGQGSSGQSDSQAPARPRRSFTATAAQKKPAADAPVKRKFEEKAAPKPAPDSPKPWRQRRSAAERKADGSYKPRQRNAPKPRP